MKRIFFLLIVMYVFSNVTSVPFLHDMCTNIVFVLQPEDRLCLHGVICQPTINLLNHYIRQRPVTPSSAHLKQYEERKEGNFRQETMAQLSKNQLGLGRCNGKNRTRVL